jgi:hypothetical protein
MQQNQGIIDNSDLKSEITEIYSGKFSIAEAIRRLRMRLLDLTSRNRLLRKRGQSMNLGISFPLHF